MVHAIHDMCNSIDSMEYWSELIISNFTFIILADYSKNMDTYYGHLRVGVGVAIAVAVTGYVDLINLIRWI